MNGGTGTYNLTVNHIQLNNITHDNLNKVSLNLRNLLQDNEYLYIEVNDNNINNHPKIRRIEKKSDSTNDITQYITTNGLIVTNDKFEFTRN